MRSLTLVTVALLLLGTASAVLIAGERSRHLGATREVEVVLDYTRSLILAGKLGYDPAAFAGGVAAGGAGALGVAEVSMEDLPYRPGVSVLQGYEWLDGPAGAADDLRARGLWEPWYTYVLTTDRPFAAFLVEWAERRLGPGRAELAGLGGGLHAAVLRGVPTVERPDPLLPDRVRLEPKLRFGFWPGDLAVARSLGLRTVAVLRRDPQLEGDDLRALFTPLAEAGVTAVYFAPGAVPADRTRAQAMAGMLRELDLTPGVVRAEGERDFGPLAAALDGRAVKFREVRVDRPLEEYLDAVHERYVRGLLFEPAVFPGPPGASLWDNQSLLARLTKTLARGGYGVGPVEPLAPYRPPAGLLAPVGAAVGAAGFALAGLLARRRGWRRPGMGGLAVAAGVPAAVAYLWPGVGREALALLAAVVFPAWMTLTVWEAHGRWRRPALPSLGWTVLAVAGAVAGGLLINSLLGDTVYVLEARLFRGVKLAHALPPVIVAAAVLAGRAGAVGRRQLSLGEFLLGTLLAGVAVVYLTRTGNQPLVAPSGLEMSLRESLEQWLTVRPRIKEFLIGHPALFLLPLGVAAGRDGPALGMALLATVGLVSVVNSFAHIHTPVVLSLLRTGFGLVLGAGLGLAAMLALTGWRRGVRS